LNNIGVLASAYIKANALSHSIGIKQILDLVNLNLDFIEIMWGTKELVGKS
jgi:hypothetical protein